LETILTNGANSTRIARASGAAGRVQIYRPNDPATVSVEFGGGNDEIRIRNGSGTLSHTGSLFQIGSASSMQVGAVSGTLTLGSNLAIAQTITGANTSLSGVIQLGTFTVGTLPSASANTRALAYVTDSSIGTFGSIVSAGGSLGVTVYSNGTNWLVTGGSVVPQKAITSGTAAPSGGVDGDIYLQYV
jgi:hypothetical protein